MLHRRKTQIAETSSFALLLGPGAAKSASESRNKLNRFFLCEDPAPLRIELVFWLILSGSLSLGVNVVDSACLKNS